MTAPDNRPFIDEIVVVEGLHDKQAVDRAVQADVWYTGGDRLAVRFLAELKRAVVARGVIVFTDPDGPGERIRRRIDKAVPRCRHAYLPQRLARGHGKIGIEHASPEIIRAALLAARGDGQSTVDRAVEFSLNDLAAAGLVGSPSAAVRRAAMGDLLNIGYGNAKAFVHKLNALFVTRSEWDAALAKLREDWGNDAE